MILPGCIALAGLFSSCSMFDDFLTVYPTNQVTGEQFWEDKNDLTSVLASCYKQLTTSDVLKRMFVWGELRSDNFILKSEDDQNIKDIVNANLLPTNGWYNWSSYYRGIGYCNLVLSKGEEVIAKDPSFTESDWKPMAAECKALRALYYFYLVRAFRDVPFNVKANDTSEDARDPMPQIPSETILSFLINDLENCKDDGMTDYGNDVYNTSRITKNAIYALLADLYLWRAAKNSCPDSAAKYPGQSQRDYQRVIELCDVVIADKLHEFQKEKEYYYGSTDPSKMPLPIYQPTSFGRIQDLPYQELFGRKGSLESIFEIAFDGSRNINSLVTSFYGGLKDGTHQSGLVGGSSIYQEVDLRPDMAQSVYCQTDLRAVESIMYQTNTTSSSNDYRVIKYVAQEVEVLDGSNVRKAATSASAANVNYSGIRSTSSCDANWIIYRVSDVILMKAEAIACSCEEGDPLLEEAFNLTNAVLDRSNPMMESKYRLKYTSYSTPTALYDFVMRERQREFFAEGKRWFDLVRMAMRDNSTQNMLNLLVAKYASNSSAIKAKLATMNSLFSPVLKDEMKVNPALVQNPAWIVDEDIVRN